MSRSGDHRPAPAPLMAAPPADAAQGDCQVWSNFCSLREAVDWAALSRSASSVFETPAWFENLATTCPAAGTSLQLLTVTAPECTTMLALRLRNGGKMESLSNFYAPVFGPCSTDHAMAVGHARQFARWLARRRTSRLQVHPLDTAAPFWQGFMQALRDEGYWVDRYFAFGNWYHPCHGTDWAGYLAGRPSRLRNTIVRTRRKLLADPGCRVSVLDASTPAADMQHAVTEFQAVYAHSWKKPEPHASFIASFCQLAHANGWLRVGLCHLNGQPVAAQLWLVMAGTASIFKLAYDERHAKRGVGTVVSAALSEHVLDIDRVSEIDFLAGDDNYKSEWMSSRRERYGIIAFHPQTLMGLGAAALHFGGRAVHRPVARGKWEGRPAS